VAIAPIAVSQIDLGDLREYAVVLAAMKVKAKEELVLS
jgi:hypothetical protein